MKHVPGCMAWLVLAALALMIVSGILNGATGGSGQAASSDTSRDGSRMTLSAAPINPQVQMFDTLHDEPDLKVTTFPNGTVCTKLGGPFVVEPEVSPMYFYRLNCNGITGYVNVRWTE